LKSRLENSQKTRSKFLLQESDPKIDPATGVTCVQKVIFEQHFSTEIMTHTRRLSPRKREVAAA